MSRRRESLAELVRRWKSVQGLADLSARGPYATLEDRAIAREHHYSNVRELRAQRAVDDINAALGDIGMGRYSL